MATDWGRREGDNFEGEDSVISRWINLLVDKHKVK